MRSAAGAAIVFFSVLLFCGHRLLAQDPDDVRSQLADSTGISAGRTLFKQDCGFCHAPDARGASGPDLIRSALVSHDVNGNLIGQVVRNGRPEKGMPAFPLSDAQILQIADFLHAEVKLAATVYSRETEYPLERLLVGKPEAGKSFFNGSGGCAQCHSPTGDLAHIASKYKAIDLQTRIAFPSGTAPSLIVTEPSGKRFTGEQVYADEFIISLRDKNGWIKTFNRNQVKVEVHDRLAAHERLLTTYSDKNIHDLLAYLETLK
ncbi:MAG: cytochrome c [Bryobacteraceae bacterium]